MPDELENTTNVTVGSPDTETAGFGPPEEFERMNQSVTEEVTEPVGDEDTRDDTTVDDGAFAEDTTSEPQSSYDENALRMDQLRNYAYRAGAPSNVVDTFKSPEALEGYLYGLASSMGRQAPTNGQTQQQAPSPLSLNLPEEIDPALREAFGTFGNGLNQRLSTYDQQSQQFASVLLELADRQDRIMRMQQDAAINRFISSTEPEVQAVFKEPAMTRQLRDEMEVIQAGRRARGAAELPDEELIQRGVALVAFPKLKQMERDRLAKAQAKRAKAASPKPSSAKTTDQDMSPEDKAKADFYLEQQKIAAKFGR